VRVTGDLKLDPPTRRARSRPISPRGSAMRRSWSRAARTRRGGGAARRAARVGAAGGAPRSCSRRAIPSARARCSRSRARRPPRALRSERGGALAAGDVGVLDTLGELAALYARAAIALRRRHARADRRPQPARARRGRRAGGVRQPLANVRHAAELLESVRAGECVADAAGLARAIGGALAAPDAARGRGAAGRAALAAHRGSSERSAALIDEVLAAHGAGRAA
jgi:hypothetical protein